MSDIIRKNVRMSSELSEKLTKIAKKKLFSQYIDIDYFTKNAINSDISVEFYVKNTNKIVENRKEFNLQTE